MNIVFRSFCQGDSIQMSWLYLVQERMYFLKVNNIIFWYTTARLIISCENDILTVLINGIPNERNHCYFERFKWDSIKKKEFVSSDLLRQHADYMHKCSILSHHWNQWLPKESEKFFYSNIPYHSKIKRSNSFVINNSSYFKLILLASLSSHILAKVL